MKKFLDLGMQPLANSYVTLSNLKKKEKKFRLEICFDTKNYLVSIINRVPKEKMFNKDYPYKSSESNTMKKSFKELSDKIKKKYNPKHILEIGSNDGPFLKNFKKNQIIGIEPCGNLANITKKLGYITISKYWNTDLAKKLTKKKKFQLIYSANTLSHIKNIFDIFKAIEISLSDDGVLILEDPSLLECVKNLAYDQFYCEHLYVFSAIALQECLRKHDLEIFNIEHTKTHGGSNRYYIKKRTNTHLKINKNVLKNFKQEKKYGLNKFITYKNFAQKVNASRLKLKKIFRNIKAKNERIIGYGATAKSCTVLNYCNLGKNEIEFFYDTTSFKINKYLPGTKIKIKKYKPLDVNEAKYVFLGAWNFKSEIFKKEKIFIKNGGKFITHIPSPKII
tara:strand:+ start:274 stop:1452 length:1179 start_codon:yes stop_codon:yes gene_type:complete